MTSYHIIIFCGFVHFLFAVVENKSNFQYLLLQRHLCELSIIRSEKCYNSSAFYEAEYFQVLDLNEELEKCYMEHDFVLQITASGLVTNLFYHIPTDDTKLKNVNEIVEILKNYLIIDHVNDPSGFLVALEQDKNVAPPSDISFTDDINGHPVSIFTSRISAIKQFYERLQMLALFFIDGASKIEVDDRWVTFMMFEHEIVNGRNRYYYIGYSSIYEFFSYPNKIKPRISQFFIFPEFQRQGFGRMLLKYIYKHYEINSDVVEITVEDPCDAFCKLRDVVDVERALKCLSFESVNCGFSKERGTQWQKQLHIPINRIRRIYEITRYYHLRRNSANLESFKEEIKHRLRIAKKRDAQYHGRMAEKLKVFEAGSSSSSNSGGSELSQEGANGDSNQTVCVDEEYQQLLKEYNTILESFPQNIN